MLDLPDAAHVAEPFAQLLTFLAGVVGGPPPSALHIWFEPEQDDVGAARQEVSTVEGPPEALPAPLSRMQRA